MKNLKKVSKRIMTLFMLMLSLVMSVPNVFAETQANASTIGEGNVGAIKISGIEETRLADVTISAYQLMTTNIKTTVDGEGNITSWQPKEPVFTWNADVAAWLRSKTNYSKYVDNKGNVTSEFTQCKDGATDTTHCLTADDAKAFYDELATVIKGFSNVPVKVYTNNGRNNTTPWTEEGNSTVISGLDMGNYLVLIENGVNIYAPSAINVVPTKAEGSNVWTAGDTELTVKYKTPSIEKEIVGDTQGEVGKVINYKVTVKVPQYPELATAKTVIVADKFSDGLTFNAGSIHVYTSDPSNEGATELTSGFTIYTSEPDTCYVTGKDEEGNDIQKCHTFLIKFTDYDAIKDFTKIYVTYSGTINGKAVVTDGNNNTATLRYNNNPYDTNSYVDGDDDTEKVYTYGVKVTKVKEGEESVKLAGAKFEVYTSLTGGEAIKFMPVLDEEGNAIPGVYRKAEAGENGITELTVASDGETKGILEVRGLAAGTTYYFEETEAPEGYVKLQRRVDVTITDNDKDGKVDTDNKADGFVETNIANNDDIPVLPVTGGIGTILFSVIGIVFMGLGAFLIKNIFKKEDAE